jgi:toxin FitB
MRTYLVDTSVLSALAPGRTESLLPATKWLLDNSEALYLSTVTIAEIHQGISKLRRIGGQRKAQHLSQWLDLTCASFGNRIIAIDQTIAKIAGEMSDAANAIARNPGFADILIAATAKAKNAELLTRNVRHFEPLGIRFSDPFEWTVK